MAEKVNDMGAVWNKRLKAQLSLNRSIKNIASVSEQSAAGIEQASASVNNKLQNGRNFIIEEISNNSQTLSELADQLNAMIRKFKL